MPVPPLIAIGASAGGIEALHLVLPNLPSGFPAAVAVVIHRMPVDEHDRLSRVLAIDARLPVSTVSDRDPIEAGRVYVCPAGVHLVAETERFRLNAGPRENRTRPAIDVLFRTAAEAFGHRAAGVVLSGLLDDGTAGLGAIKAHGGFAVVQDPLDAAFGDMPRNAIENVNVDAIAPASEIAALLVEFAQRKASGNGIASPVLSPERTEPSLFSCPDCGGVLSQVDSEGVTRFRCRTGHAYSPQTLFEAQEEGLETALWAALRALVERGDLSQRLAQRSRDRGLHAAAKRFDRQANAAQRRADTVRAALEGAQTALDAVAVED